LGSIFRLRTMTATPPPGTVLNLYGSLSVPDFYAALESHYGHFVNFNAGRFSLMALRSHDRPKNTSARHL
jgi:hypothetical protein